MQNTLIDNSSEKLSMTNVLRHCISSQGLNEIKIATGYWDIPGIALVVNELSDFLAKDDAKLKIVIGREMFVYANQVISPLVDPKFPQDEKHNYEIDFMLSRGNKVCPIEVKSSGYKSHASLDAFCDKYSARVGNRYLVYTKDLRKDGETLLVPVYMTSLL